MCQLAPSVSENPRRKSLQLPAPGVPRFVICARKHEFRLEARVALGRNDDAFLLTLRRRQRALTGKDEVRALWIRTPYGFSS